MTHNWSGFPGAWCFDCGQECYEELELAGLPPEEIEHLNRPCPEPGSNRNNPYVKQQIAIDEDRDSGAV